MSSSEKLNDINIYNEIVLQYQREQACYLQELELLEKNIKSIFDNPKSGVNGDTVDVIFGNIGDIISVERKVKLDLSEAVTIAHNTLIPVGTVFHHHAKLEQFYVYLYYANNYSWSTRQIHRLRQHTDLLKYTFADCVKLGLSEDTILNLLDVLLFKPVHFITQLFDLLRELLVCLKNMTKESKSVVIEVEMEYLQDTLSLLQDTEITVQDVLDRYYNVYRYYPLYLVPRPTGRHSNLAEQPVLLFNGYIFHIVEKTTDMKYLELTEDTLTIHSLGEDQKHTDGKIYNISSITAVKDYHNDLNQFSVTLQDQVLQFLSNSSESKSDILATLTVLLCRRILVDSTPPLTNQQTENISLNQSYNNKTLEDLVQDLLHSPDPQFRTRFLIVCKLFTTPRQLLNNLLLLFNRNIGENNNIRLLILGVLRNWITVNRQDFLRDGLFTSTLKVFLDSCKRSMQWMCKWVGMLDSMLYHDTVSRDRTEEESLWYLTQDLTQFSLFTLHPIEIARQITLIEHKHFTDLPACDMFSGEGPVLSKLRCFQDRYVTWMRRTIVETQHIDERKYILRCIFVILETLHKVQNYSGMFAVYNVIHSAEIYRLKHSLQELLAEYKSLLNQIENMMKESYQEYWEAIRIRKAPLIPVLGLYKNMVKKLSIFKQKTSGTTDDSAVIEYDKCLKLFDVMAHLCVLQNGKKYTFSCEQSIQDYLQGVQPYEAITRKEFLSELYDKSLLLEPTNCTKAVYFPRKTKHDLSSSFTTEFFGWKSSSITVDKPIHSTSEDSDNKDTKKKMRPLSKSKSFSSKGSSPIRAPPLPPRVQALQNKSNCLSRSKSFEHTSIASSPYDMYMLPSNIAHKMQRDIRLNEKRSVSPVLLQKLQNNIPAEYARDTPAALHRSAQYICNTDDNYAEYNIQRTISNIRDSIKNEGRPYRISPPARPSKQQGRSDRKPPTTPVREVKPIPRRTVVEESPPPLPPKLRPVPRRPPRP